MMGYGSIYLDLSPGRSERGLEEFSVRWEWNGMNGVGWFHVPEREISIGTHSSRGRTKFCGVHGIYLFMGAASSRLSCFATGQVIMSPPFPQPHRPFLLLAKRHGRAHADLRLLPRAGEPLFARVDLRLGSGWRPPPPPL